VVVERVLVLVVDMPAIWDWPEVLLINGSVKPLAIL
jgi:hypothetical protein